MLLRFRKVLFIRLLVGFVVRGLAPVVVVVVSKVSLSMLEIDVKVGWRLVKIDFLWSWQVHEPLTMEAST